MKKILFLIFGLMSFTASADMEKLWQHVDGSFITKAYCVFEDEGKRKGSIYLYINHQTKGFLVEPLLDWNSQKVTVCYRASIRAKL